MRHDYYGYDQDYDYDEARRARPLFEADDPPRIGRLLRASHRRNARCERTSIRRLPTFGAASWCRQAAAAERDERDDGEWPF